MESATAPMDYAGFWVRFFAMLLDCIILTLVLIPLLLLAFGSVILTDPEALETPSALLVQYGFPLIATVLFWKYRSATPGKMMMGVVIVDAETGGPVPTGRLVLRYFGYIVSTLPLCLGYLWIAFDPRKQGFHDKIAKTLVVKKPAQAALRAAA